MSTLLALALATLIGQSGESAARTETLALQVALDRAGYSPGIIDGQPGANTTRALEAYRKGHGADPKPAADYLRTYTITDGDVNTPFVQAIPEDMIEKAQLPSLTYESIAELLAERFHTSPELLQRLNPGAAFTAGEQIRVPNVEPFIVPAPERARQEKGTSGRASDPGALNAPADKPDVVVTVSQATSALTVTTGEGAIVLYAPVTTGSERDPLPIGEWKVIGVQYSPEFRYNPDLFWDADPAHAKATLKPGPNNPVGVVWIDLSKEHYGIHGTPEPAAIGKTASHGCVRLTNWDALKVAGLVKPGTRVVFTP